MTTTMTNGRGGCSPPGASSSGGRGLFAAFRGTWRIAVVVVLAASSFAPPNAHAQTEVVTPGAEYGAGATKARLLGEDYRDLWTTPIRVPILDLDSFAGGLTPTRRGGGRQTTSLRFRGADGREYQFRSVDKIPGLARHPDLHGSLLGDLIQDQVSSMIPAAPLVAAPLTTAAGLLVAVPHIFLMPDDPALGEFREEFAGMLGTIEERPDEREETGSGFAGLDRIVGTETMLDHLEENGEHRVDDRSYLTARLLDLFLGDWDRHEDQWRWGRTEEEEGRVLWIPIPRDRDYAFANYDGALLNVARAAVPNAVRFGPEYEEVAGVVLNATDLDRQLLAWTGRSVWDSVATALQDRLTDEVIDSAVRRMPPEHHELRGDELSGMLRSRRDRLPEAASEFYLHLARVVDFRASDEDELAEILRHPDGSVEVTLGLSDAGEAEGGVPPFHRIFLPGETREIRIHMRGGGDRAVVRGSGSRGIRVRVIGGGGTDDLRDESAVTRRGKWTSLHDAGDEDTLRGSGSTIIDRRDYDEPERRPPGLIRIPRPDAGSRTFYRPLLNYSTTTGPLIGAGVTRTQYAFRRHPHEIELHSELVYSPRWSAFGAEASAHFQSANPAIGSFLEVRASQIDAMRFYGFGNETSDAAEGSHFVVRRETAAARAELMLSPLEWLTLSAGPLVSYARPWQTPGTPLVQLRPRGWDGWSAWGIGGEMEARRVIGSLRDLEVTATAGGSALLALLGGDQPYGTTHAAARLGSPLGPVRIDLHGGWRQAWGEYPFHEAAFLGGLQTLRGYPEWRFAGDAVVYGGLEGSTGIARLPLLLNWRTRGFLFFDAGRVYLDGEGSDRWHSAPGGGLSFEALDFFVRLSYAHGPTGRLYLESRAPL